MSYILMVWTVVAMVGDHHGVGASKYDWRPLGVFESTSHTSKALCEDAALQLGIKAGNYRCVRSK
jgi:hypothetical protein